MTMPTNLKRDLNIEKFLFNYRPCFNYVSYNFRIRFRHTLSTEYSTNILIVTRSELVVICAINNDIIIL